jgi:uncharacterized OsmC-like protein
MSLSVENGGTFVSQSDVAYAVRSASSGTLKRTITSMRQHHIIIDSPSIGEEITSGEAFFAGVASCGVTLIEGAAQEMQIPLKHMEVTIEAFRPTEPGRVIYSHVDMGFVLHGVSREQGEALLDRYKGG